MGWGISGVVTVSFRCSSGVIPCGVFARMHSLPACMRSSDFGTVLLPTSLGVVGDFDLICQVRC